MKITVKAGKAQGSVKAPPSKSIAHRTILCAALANGQSEITHVAHSEDLLATIDCARELGADIQWRGHETLDVIGTDKPTQGAVFPCRESGSTLRFFIPVALTGMEREVTFLGSKRLMERGIGLYRELLPLHGAEIVADTHQILAKGKLQVGHYTLRGDISSQFITGLLTALPLLAGDSTLEILPPVESRAYIDITLQVLKQFGITVREPYENYFEISGNQHYLAGKYDVEGDWSNAAFLLAFNELGGHVTVTGLSENSMQGDRICQKLFNQTSSVDNAIDISGCPDLGPILFSVAAAKQKGAYFTGTKRLKIKESDRAKAMAQELAKFGIQTELGANWFKIFSGALKAPDQMLFGHNDHRIVMALTVLSSVTGGSIEGIEAVSKSFPDFFEVLQQLGLHLKMEETA